MTDQLSFLSTYYFLYCCACSVLTAGEVHLFSQEMLAKTGGDIAMLQTH
ncbi:putative secreted protein [Granulibacter bethesdensis]|uniref:Secreted protein n=1 Tax=Granulibacter bethesdensis (strain ATCC BAA-1260 / CGDNIH1) TaxID=391165 RepID=Q0BQR3_GRABC|nr:putative secreted protein [Granulibacter bethesdensis CGDNIH1]APG30746.1 putative secreted protein [Granulibacter bethesdensis]APH52705.1 putative secreted protein [Granulibacter bethesdensis]APH65393.1 putative secreted protein [Granulibacter bethesdensis]